MTKQLNEGQYETYLAGNSWHCPDALINPAIPLQVQYNTGAHYWKLFPNGSGRWYCKYCYELRRFRWEVQNTQNGGQEE